MLAAMLDDEGNLRLVQDVGYRKEDFIAPAHG
jgi:hypothetical protein